MKRTTVDIIVATQVSDEDFAIIREWWAEGPGYVFDEDEAEELESLSGTRTCEELEEGIEKILGGLTDAEIVSHETEFCCGIYAFIWEQETNCFELVARFPTGGGFADRMEWFLK